jgi:hypothetical protein
LALLAAGVINELPARTVQFLPQKIITPDDLVAAVHVAQRLAALQR